MCPQLILNMQDRRNSNIRRQCSRCLCGYNAWTQVMLQVVQCDVGNAFWESSIGCWRGEAVSAGLVTEMKQPRFMFECRQHMCHRSKHTRVATQAGRYGWPQHACRVYPHPRPQQPQSYMADNVHALYGLAWCKTCYMWPCSGVAWVQSSPCWRAFGPAVLHQGA